MTDQYKLMIYFAVATLYFYRKDIVPCKEGQTLGVFADNNSAIIQKVKDEAISLFNYELSDEQIGRTLKAFCAEPQSVC